MRKTALLLAVIVIFTACSKKTFTPLYHSKPMIESAPDLRFAKERTVPKNENLSLVFNLSGDATPDSDDYFNNPGAKKSEEGNRPSIIIAPPKEIEIQGKKVKEFEQNPDDFNNIFRSDGYYNEAEQAIEKALLRIGFNVLDRSKFEAKLRDLRDRANERPWWYADWNEKLLENGEFDALKDEYKRQLKEGEITGKEYAEIISEVDKLSQRGLPGKKRDEDEMNDIAEVIRAAQTGADQADYLLQINEVVVADAGNRYLKLKNVPEVRKFVNANDGLRFGDTKDKIPTVIPSRWLRASFNAKLIEVKTGSIVWIGSHEIESAAAEEIEVSFEIYKKVSNELEINRDIKNYNSSLRNTNTELLKLKAELEGLYEIAMQEKKFKKPVELETYSNSIKSRIANKEKEYQETLSQLRYKLDNPPSASSADWNYVYEVTAPNIDPDLLADARSNTQGRQRLMQHRKELINKVTQELIKTIVIE